MKSIPMISLLFTLVFSMQLNADNGNPEELGNVSWLRNLADGLVQSATSKKPVFLLFQEVPGCSTCRNYGQNVLSHPLIVEAIETLFIPVAIFNNKGGKDAEVLKYFGEPAWNNPVVRIVNNKKQDLIQRVNGNYSQLGVVQAMRLALQVENLEVPTYLMLLEAELVAAQTGTESAIFSMYCFWTGEKEIGKLDGVLETQAGFMNGREVVKVKFDPDKIAYKNLLQSANRASCASHVYTDDKVQVKASESVIGQGTTSDTGKFRQDQAPKYYLGKTVYRFIPMTQLQAVKVNSLIGQQQLPDILLSPRQLALLERIQANPNGQWKDRINEDFVKAWEEVARQKKA